MLYRFDPRPSAPECQLCKDGNDRSFNTLKEAVAHMTDQDLEALEEELQFHSETGLVGVRMSRLSVLLRDCLIGQAA